MLTSRTIEVRPPEIASKYNFLFKDMTGSEGLGRPFWFDVDLLSRNGHVDKRELLGEPMTVVMQMEGDVEPRYFNGLVAEFTQTGWTGEFFTYQARLRPQLAMLTHKTDSRIFQTSKLGGKGGKITALDILKSVFDEHGLNVSYDMVVSSPGRLNELEYVVQYQESDFDFVSRLMEREGIYYFFRHEIDKHQMVLADQTADFYLDGSTYAKVSYFRPDEPGSDLPPSGYIDRWETRMQVQPGQYTARDFDFEAPRASRTSKIADPKDQKQSKYEVYEYPGRYPTDPQAEGGPRYEYTKRRLEEQQTDYEQAIGAGTARMLNPGAAFALVGYSGEPEDRKFLVTWAKYTLWANDHTSGSGGSAPDYRVQFGAMDVRFQYRPPVKTPRPTVKGPQTAIVVGAPDSEITTDEYGRVKVKFHWDRADNRDDTSSCFVRVAQVWAGAKWGAMFMPRIGQEVIVDFLEGDPDQPIIVGRVYNKDRMPPYDPRTHATVSTIKSMSSPGGGGFNELRFEDKKDSEQVFLHAQRRMDVRVGTSLHETVRGSREETIGHEDKGDLNRLVSHDVNAHAKGGQFELIGTKLNQNVKDEVVEVFEASHTVAVTNRQTLNAKETAIEAKQTLSLKGDMVVAQGGQSLSLKAGNIKIEGTQSISLKVGGNFVVLTPSGVFINGTMVMLNSGGAAQAADAPLAIQDPTIETPIDPAAADSSLPGEHGHGGSGGARTRASRKVKLQRAPEPPPPPALLHELPPAVLGEPPAGDRAVITVVWVEDEIHCGGPATLRGTTRGYADGVSENATVRNSGDGATVVGTALAIRGNAFNQNIEVKDWLPRRIGDGFEEFRDEDAHVAGKKTPRPLRMKFVPNLNKATCTITSSTGVSSQFEMVVRNYECQVEGNVKYVRGRMAWIIQLGDTVPASTRGQTGVNFGPFREKEFSGSDWRFAKGDPSHLSTMTFWDGVHWQPVPATFSDPRNVKLYGIGIWREGLVNKAQLGGVWPEPLLPWTESQEAAAEPRLRRWKSDTEATWTNKFDLRRDGCFSTDQKCCRYSVRVKITFSRLEERRDDHVIIIAVNKGRSNAKAWSLSDLRPGLAPHEFGHHLGNPDEYSGGVGIDRSVNSDGARAGIDETSLMGSVPDSNIPPIRGRHLNIVKRHLAVMVNEQRGIVWTFNAVPRL